MICVLWILDTPKPKWKWIVLTIFTLLFQHRLVTAFHGTETNRTKNNNKPLKNDWISSIWNWWKLVKFRWWHTKQVTENRCNECCVPYFFYCWSKKRKEKEEKEENGKKISSPTFVLVRTAFIAWITSNRTMHIKVKLVNKK